MIYSGKGREIAPYLDAYHMNRVACIPNRAGLRVQR